MFLFSFYFVMTKPVIFLMGPTASGKTALAIELVQQFPMEIISVDSALIYRDMNIGTAKPNSRELAMAPHHLIDILDPTEHYSVGAFLKDALGLIAEIHTRGKTPLLVGGTMLYFKALQQGLANLPEKDIELRKEIDRKAKLAGWPHLHSELALVDAVSAARIKPTDSQRIGRALEVFYLTGKPLSALHCAKSSLAKNMNFIPLALFPSDRTLLHERIDKRVYDMLQAGLVDEVTTLRKKYTLNPELPAMRALGYRQVWQCLEGTLTANELHNRILFATRQYAKRQLTWLKSWEGLERFEIGSLNKGAVAKRLRDLL